MRRTRGINKAQSKGTRSLYSWCAVMGSIAVQPDGSKNLQTVTSDLAHWCWQPGIIKQKSSCLLRRSNRGLNHTSVLIPQRVTLVRTCLRPGNYSQCSLLELSTNCQVQTTESLNQRLYLS